MNAVGTTNPGNPPAGFAASLAIHDHELLRPIASGSYGEVWLARNAVGTLRAVKIVRRDRFERAEDFEREFKGLQNFEPISRAHEGLVDILQIGRNDAEGWFYYVMELADDANVGQASSLSGAKGNSNAETGATPVLRHSPRTLRADLKSRGALPADEVITLGLKLTAALAHLHAQGLVHRDVKPSNILFIGGEPKLADAGLVATIDDARSLVGTVGYIAPEGPGTPQADLYALGKVLYEAAFEKDRQEFPALPANIASRSDHARLLELNEIIAKACATDPRKRYAEVIAMQCDLELLRRGSSIKQKHLRSRLWAISVNTALSFVGLALVASIAAHFSRSKAVIDAQSRIPRVNQLVTEGDGCLLSATPERLQQGLAFFQEAITLDPDFVPAHFGVHRVYVALGNLEGSRSVAPKLMKLAPDSAEAQVALAYQLWIDWRFQEALQTARRATELPAYTRRAKSRAHLAYGFQLLQTGQPEAALAQYRIAGEIAAKLSLSDPALEHHLGHPYFAQRNFAEALKHYGRSLKIEDRHSSGHYWKARTYEEMEDFEKAIQAFREFLSLEKKDMMTTQLCDELREAVRQRGRAGYWGKRLEFELRKPEPDLYTIATVYAHLSDKEHAYEYLRKACQQHSFTQGLMFDLCWDHTDPEFKAIAKGIGIIR